MQPAFEFLLVSEERFHLVSARECVQSRFAGYPASDAQQE